MPRRVATPDYTPPIPWITVFNTTEEEIPPFGVMLGDQGVDHAGRVCVRQPVADGMVGNILFNGDAPIAPGTSGQAQKTFPAAAAYDPDGEQYPEPGDPMGTSAGSWLLSPKILGFVCTGLGPSGTVNVDLGEQYSPTVVEVRNDTGMDLPVFGVVSTFSPPLTKPQDDLKAFQSLPAFSGTTPGTIVSIFDPGAVGAGVYWLKIVMGAPNQELYQRNEDNDDWDFIRITDIVAEGSSGNFAITKVPIAHGQKGPATIFGATKARLLLQHFEDASAGIGLGDTKHLTTGALGAAILNRQSVWGATIVHAEDSGDGTIKLTTDENHELSNDAVVRVYGVAGTTEANDVWQITVADGLNIILQDSEFTNHYVSGGTILLVTTKVTEFDPPSSSGPIEVTSPNHHLETGDEVELYPDPAGDGVVTTWTVDVVDEDTFTLRGTESGGTQSLGVIDGVDEVVDDDGSAIVVDPPSPYLNAQKVVWADILINGGGYGFVQVLADVTCTANGLVKSYRYVQGQLG